MSHHANIEAARAGGLDFTAHRHPVLAVECPDCRVRVGAWCKRPSGHTAMDLHLSRRQAADAAWEEARLPTITQVGPGKYVYDEAPPIPADQPEETEGMRTATAKAKDKRERASKARSTERRKRETKPAAGAKESKADIINRLLSSKNGTTRAALSEATGFPHVNLRTAAERVEKVAVVLNDRYRLVAKGVDLEEAHKDGWKNVF